MSNAESDRKPDESVDDDDEPDEWETRIFSTGCAEENTKLNDCFYEKKDWRACKDEVCLVPIWWPRLLLSRTKGKTLTV